MPRPMLRPLSRPAAGIAVVGGGPAGCVAAKRLAETGYDVTLIASRRRRVACEGVSDRVLDALRGLGCQHGLDAIGATVARQATWNGETSSRNREHLVVRQAFDAALLADAAFGALRMVPR